MIIILGIEATEKDVSDDDIRNRFLHLYINLQKTLNKIDSEEEFPRLESALIEVTLFLNIKRISLLKLTGFGFYGST